MYTLLDVTVHKNSYKEKQEKLKLRYKSKAARGGHDFACNDAGNTPREVYEMK